MIEVIRELVQPAHPVVADPSGLRLSSLPELVQPTLKYATVDTVRQSSTVLRSASSHQGRKPKTSWRRPEPPTRAPSNPSSLGPSLALASANSPTAVGPPSLPVASEAPRVPLKCHGSAASSGGAVAQVRLAGASRIWRPVASPAGSATGGAPSTSRSSSLRGTNGILTRPPAAKSAASPACCSAWRYCADPSASPGPASATGTARSLARLVEAAATPSGATIETATASASATRSLPSWRDSG